jgi:sugar phosphate isomerase/epimerase
MTATDPTQNPLRIAMGDLTFRDTPFPDRVTMLAELGYWGVGFRTGPSAWGLPFLKAGSPEMREVKLRLADTGLKVVDAESIRLSDGQRSAGYDVYLEGAADVGAGHIIVVCDIDDEHRAAEHLARVADDAGQMGLGIVLEYMAYVGINCLAKADRVISLAGRSDVGHLVDMLHLCRAGDDAEGLRRIAPARLRHFQICDAAFVEPGDTESLRLEARFGRRIPGEGALPLFDLVAAMPADAVASVEIPYLHSYPDASDREIAARALEATRKLLVERPGTRGIVHG